MERLLLVPRLAGEESHREREAVEMSLLTEADRVFTTIGTAGRSVFARIHRGFDVVLVDEAAQCTEPAVLVALLNRPYAVLVGDPQQLPATVLSPLAKVARYDVSLFERLASGGTLAPIVLQEQYRMDEAIVAKAEVEVVREAEILLKSVLKCVPEKSNQ